MNRISFQSKRQTHLQNANQIHLVWAHQNNNAEQGRATEEGVSVCGKESRAQRNQIYSEHNDWTFGYITAHRNSYSGVQHTECKATFQFIYLEPMVYRLSQTYLLSIWSNVYSLCFSIYQPLSLSLPGSHPRLAETDCIHQAKHSNTHTFCVMNRILLLKMTTIMPDALWPSQNPIPNWMNDISNEIFFFLSTLGVCHEFTFDSVDCYQTFRQQTSLFLILMCLLFNLLLPIVLFFMPNKPSPQETFHDFFLCAACNFNFNFIQSEQKASTHSNCTVRNLVDHIHFEQLH